MDLIISLIIWIFIATVSVFAFIFIGGALLNLAEKVFGTNFWKEK